MGPSSTPSNGLEFYADPAKLLSVAGDYLAANPVTNTVVTTVAHRAVADADAGVQPPEQHWWVVVRDGTGAVCGAGMRTAPFVPYPPYLLPMPDEAAVELAQIVHGRGEEVLAV